MLVKVKVDILEKIVCLTEIKILNGISLTLGHANNNNKFCLLYEQLCLLYEQLCLLHEQQLLKVMKEYQEVDKK